MLTSLLGAAKSKENRRGLVPALRGSLEQVEVDTQWVRLWFGVLPAHDKQPDLVPRSSICAEAGRQWLAAGQAAATGLC